MINSPPLQPANGQFDSQIGALVVLALAFGGAWMFLRKVSQGSPPPEPWDDQTAAEIEADEAVPLCHQCLAPHFPSADFCPECGASVGKYTNLMPYPYVFSVGHVLRTGSFGRFKRSPLTIAGFLMFGLMEYSLFVPAYWFMLFRNVFRERDPDSPQSQPPQPATGEI